MNLLENIASLSPLELWGDLHGAVAMFALILFGTTITLTVSLGKFDTAVRWLKSMLALLLADLVVLDLLGLFIYIPYRASGGPRTFLLSSETTAWLHQVVFEHKEFLAFAPPVLVLVATILAFLYGKSLPKETTARKAILFSLVAALVLVLVVASEAVLVTKTAPLQ